MLNSFLHGVVKALAIPLIFILNVAGFPSQTQAPVTPVPDYSQDIAHIKIQIADLQLATEGSQNLSGTNVLPQNIAFFSTSLASGISSTASSMTLVSATYNNGANTLASSTYAFVIDEGTASQEMVQADCTATACTNMTRGIDFLTGTTSVTSLKFTHRRGASIKITTAPTTLLMGNIFAGTDVLPVPIKYSSSIATSTLAADRSSLASAGLVADTAFAGAGVINATSLAKGVVQIATGLQIASSTALGTSGATVVVPASQATSTWNSLTLAALKIPVADNLGKIDANFIATSTGLFANSILTGSTTIMGTTTMATTTINSKSPVLIFATSTTASIPTMTLTNIPAVDTLQIQILASSTDVNTGFTINFNNDTSASYAFKGSATTSANATYISTSGLTISQDVMEFDTITVNNMAAAPKYGFISSVYNSSGSFTNQFTGTTSAFTWNNTSGRITSIKVTAWGSGLLASGSYIKVIAQPY